MAFFFTGLLHRKLASLLHPWLREEPQLELKLGLLRSYAVATNLRFDASALDRLFDETSLLLLQELTVDQLVVRVSNWSVPAFTVEVHGVRVTLSTRESLERTSSRANESEDEHLKKSLSVIDPEGSSLHNVLERISITAPSKNRGATNFLNVALRNCRLQIQGIDVQVQFPNSKDSFAFLLEVKELAAESQYPEHRSFIGQILTAVIAPIEESYFAIDGRGFQIKTRKRDSICTVLGSADAFACIRLKCLQLVDLRLCIPELSFSFSPDDLPIMLSLCQSPSNRSKSSRNGLQLWKLAARRIGSLISATEYSLYKTASMVILWLRYINAYQLLLSLVEYSVDYLFERSIIKMVEDKKYSRSVKQQWNLISEIEKKLPVLAIAKARQIACFRAVSKPQHAHAEDACSGLEVNGYLKFFLKIFQLLSFIWKAMHFIFSPLRHLFFSAVASDDYKKIDEEGGIFFHSDCCYSTKLGKVSITVFPIHPVSHNVELHGVPSDFDLLSFSLSIDALILIYAESICKQSFSVAFGQLKVMSSSIMEAATIKTNSKNYIGLGNEHWKGNYNLRNPVVWIEPVKGFFPLDNSGNGKTKAWHNQDARAPFLESILEEMQLTWKRSCMKFEENELQNLESPCILCEIESCLFDPGLKCPDPGLWSFTLDLGRLNLSLGYSSILSIVILFQQVQHALCWDVDGAKAVSQYERSTNYSSEIDWDVGFKSYVHKMEISLLRLLPEKHIQVGMRIAGPYVQISLSDEQFRGDQGDGHIDSQDDPCLVLDINDIELAVCPTSKSDLALSMGFLGVDGVIPECFRLQEHKIIGIPISDNKNYISRGQIELSFYVRVNGISAALQFSAEKRQCQICAIEPITVLLSTLREYLYSLGACVVAVSVTFCSMPTGCTVSFYMDELFTFFQAVEVLVRVASCACVQLVGTARYQDFMKQGITLTATEELEAFAEGASTCISMHFVLIGTFQLKSVNVILHNFRNNNSVERYANTCDGVTNKKLHGYDLPDCGIRISISQACVQISCENGRMGVCSDLSRIQSLIFRYQRQTGVLSDLKNGQSVECLYEVSLSSCTIALRLGFVQDASSSMSVSNIIDDATSSDRTPYTQENFCSTIVIERPINGPLRHHKRLEPMSNITAPSSSQQLLVDIGLSEIYMGSCLMKDILVRAHQLPKLQLSLSVGGKFRTIYSKIQGGLIFLEIIALEVFSQCFASYCYCVSKLLSSVPSFTEHFNETKPDVDVTGLNNSVEDSARGMMNESQSAKWELLEECIMDLSQFSFVFATGNDTGEVQEIVLEANVRAKLELGNMGQRFVFDLSRLTILSQSLFESPGIDFRSPQTSSPKSNGLLSHYEPRDPTVVDEALPFPDHASCSINFLSQRPSSMNNCASGDLRLCRQNYILKQLNAFITVENPVPRDRYWRGSGSISGFTVPEHSNQIWRGSGSISGFDVTVSLSELQIIFSMVVSVSGVFETGSNNNVKLKNWSSVQEFDSTSGETVPNGSIVAIQDVRQHVYVTVEGVEKNYKLVGAIHYSLVGEKALFRVLYHNKRRWKSPITWFSLISLYAMSDSGEPLQLNCHQRSGFVDISSTSGSGRGLWRAIPCISKNNEGGIVWEPSNFFSKNAFYLVNKKNDCAVAFADGIPEFVKKPGNPFKFKVFHQYSLDRDAVVLNSHSLEAYGNTVRNEELADKETCSAQKGILPQIVIAIEKFSVTIVHELPDTKDRFPLLQLCISKIQSIIQILYSKVRVMSTLSAMMHYFDAQKNFWRQFIHPIETHIFYRCRLRNQGSCTASDKVPVHLCFKITELDVSLTELSLDILLFVIGKMDLVGPYSVRVSRIMANCCKVENQSCLDLLCHFNNNQDVIIARKQSSSSILLRNLALADQPPKHVSSVSIQLFVAQSFSTSPIQMSLLEDRTLAWRARIVTPQDSSSYPGPFVVVDVSRKAEDGFSLVVSPLIKIHNETQFSLELRFQRPQPKETESATMLLNPGDTIDDSIAVFDAINLSGGIRKALLSLSVGNFLFSFRPEISVDFRNSKEAISVEWSDDLKGGKAVPLPGIFDKLSYKVRKAFAVKSVTCSFSTARCSLKCEDAHAADLHFLIQSIQREVPLIPPDKFGAVSESTSSPVALQVQKEIFLFPTVRVSNLLHLEIHVLLSETDDCTTVGCGSIGKEANIPGGSAANFYANPAKLYFTITLTAFSSSCKPVKSDEWVKKLQKQNKSIDCFDIDLSFGGGKLFASLRVSRGHCGILEVAIFTPYALKNDTDFLLSAFASNYKPTSWEVAEKFGSGVPSELGLFLPPKTTCSWFLKSNALRIRLFDRKMYQALLHLDSLSGVIEISFETEEEYGFKHTTKLGLSLVPSSRDMVVSSQTVNIVPRYIVCNESEKLIAVRQCYLEDEMEGIVAVNSKQKMTLQLRNGTCRKGVVSFFDKITRKHSNNDDGLIYIQFRLNKTGFGWSGPVCITSLGRFFVKFRRSSDVYAQQSHKVTAQDNASMFSNQVMTKENSLWEFAVVHLLEEGSSLVLHFHRPVSINLPYRIENGLNISSITYYQKESFERETVGPKSTVNYVWDDLTLPHKLIVQIDDMHLLHEINLDKVRKWKPFRQHMRLSIQSQFNKRPRYQGKTDFGESICAEMVKVGFEVYADGPTRVLRISEFPDSHKEDLGFQSCAKIQLRVLGFAIHLIECGRREVEAEEPFDSPIIIARLGNISLDSLLTDEQKYNQICIESLTVEQKWVGAPFAAMLRRHQKDYSDTNNILQIVVNLLSTSSNVRQVKYSSIFLQPVDLNLDEETLMRLVPFWRKSISVSNSQSRQFYFDHFEVHPIKIIASFLPADTYMGYSSGQETLRSLLHSVIKIPAIKNKVVELNGVLVTHALITFSELLVKCAQHYSWYVMRAVYIAKGSPFLPPAFASIFDDLASSSLDVYFDPSHGFTDLPGLTLGTFKLISKCINDKGFSGTKRYLGDLGKTLKAAGSNVLFAAVTEISDSVLKGAESSGLNGMVSGFHQGILKLALEPSLLGTAFMEGGPDRKIKLDRSPGMDELYIEGYIQAMLDTIYKQDYLRVRVLDNEVLLKNLPPNSSVIDEIMDRVKDFLVSKKLLKGDSSTMTLPLRHLRRESDWNIGTTLLTLCEHLFVSFAIRILRKQAGKTMTNIKLKKEPQGDNSRAIVPVASTSENRQTNLFRKWGLGKFVLSGMLAYIDGRLCRHIPNPIARRIVSGFLLSFLDRDDTK